MTRLTVVGQGKLGFPIATYYAARGAQVVGFDVDTGLISAIRDGNPSVNEPGASQAVGDLMESGSYMPTSDPSAAYESAEAVIVLVPLLAHGGDIDFTALDRAVGTMVPLLGADSLVIFETTLPVGVTRQRFAPVLNERHRVKVAHSPERVFSGRVWADLEKYPKLVGGVDADSTAAAAAFYERYLQAEVRVLGSAEAAEMAKLAETTYRDLNIGFANELARFADEWGVDVTEVIDAANSQPYSHIHRPGVGVGGHCIPHYPYLLEASTSGSALVREGRRVNEMMPDWVVETMAKQSGSISGLNVHLLGVAYRGGVKESASSPVFGLDVALRREGAVVTVSDPLFSASEVSELGLTPGDGSEADVIVLVTDHPEYRSIDWASEKLRLFVDGRNMFERQEFESRGVSYLGIGR